MFQVAFSYTRPHLAVVPALPYWKLPQKTISASGFWPFGKSQRKTLKINLNLCKTIMFVFNSCGSSNQDQLHSDKVIESDEEVSEHTSLVESYNGSNKNVSIVNTWPNLFVLKFWILQTNSCGSTSYKSARNSNSKFKNLDETGLMMASCRHGCMLFAESMFTGENFRCVHFMQHQQASKRISISYVTTLFAVTGSFP